MSDTSEPTGAIGPVQMMVLGFAEPDFHGTIVAELERLRDLDLIRVVDALVVEKDDEGDITAVQISDLVGGGGSRQVGPLHLLDELLERLEAPRQEIDVDGDGGGDGEAEHDAGRRAPEDALGVRGDRSGDDGCSDQQQVDHQDLGEKGSASHLLVSRVRIGGKSTPP